MHSTLQLSGFDRQRLLSVIPHTTLAQVYVMSLYVSGPIILEGVSSQLLMLDTGSLFITNHLACDSSMLERATLWIFRIGMQDLHMHSLS